MSSKSNRQEGVDRISQLPDALLCHILSSLPTINAVQTTVLSRRWKNVWTSVPDLDFDDEEFNPDFRVGFYRLTTAINHVLSLRASSDIQRFRLQSTRSEGYRKEDRTLIHSWIDTVVKHNVVEIDLQLWVNLKRTQNFKIPRSLFICKTLVVLTVFSNCITYAPPTTGCFPSLKVLHVTLLLPDNGSMENLFSCCPALEHLTIKGNLGNHNGLNINISAPELKTLSIWMRYDYYMVNNYFINAAKLESIDLKEDVLSNYFLESAKSLVEATICFSEKFDSGDRNSQYVSKGSPGDNRRFPKKDPQFVKRATALLAEISSVEYLSLSGWPYCLEVHYLPTFDNLSQLELDLNDCYYWELLTEFLKRAPKLEHLVLKKEESNHTLDFPENSQRRWNPPECVPICLLTHLKTISMRGFKGGQNEMEVTKYLLKNSEVLEKMTISTEKNIDKDPQCEKREGLDNELIMFQRGSKACQVELI